MKIPLGGTIVNIEIEKIAADGDRPMRELERMTVRDIVSRVFGSEARIGHTSAGAPTLHVSGRQINISISHGGGSAGIAYTEDHRIPGIDIEAPREQLRSVSRRYMTDNEIAEADGRMDALLDYWTAKEAVYKAALTPGLPLRDINVDRRQESAQARERKFNLHWQRHKGITICIAIEEIDNY